MEIEALKIKFHFYNEATNKMLRFFILLLLVLLACRPSAKNSDDPKGSVALKKAGSQLQPFELIIYDSDYASAYALQYILTDKDLKIIFKSDLVGAKDTTLFRKDLEPSPILIKLSNLSLDNLQNRYRNRCIEDGSQISIIIKKDNKSKTIHLSNYYQPDAGLAIELINSLIPEKYEIWYDKEKLIKDQEDCAKQELQHLIYSVWY